MDVEATSVTDTKCRIDCTEQRSNQCVITFNQTVREFVDELKQTFPELEDIVNERYTSLSDKDDSVMQWFELNAKEHHMALTTKDDTLFKNHSSLFLLPDINFSQLWKCKIQPATKNAVWKYLHVLLLLVSHKTMSAVAQQSTASVPVSAQMCVQDTVESTTRPTDNNDTNDDDKGVPDMQSLFEQWNTMLDDKELSEDQLAEMKEQSENIMRLMESLNSTPEETDDVDETPHDGKSPFEGMNNDPFMKQLESSKIAQFAKELSNELDISDLGLSEKDTNMNSFQDVFGMMGKNPQKLMGLVKTVGDKIQNKMQSGDIQQTELISEAQHLMQSMGNSDVFKNIFKGGKHGRGGGGGLDPQALFQNLAKSMNINPNQFDPSVMQNMMAQMQTAGAGAGAHNSGTTRARLQQKLSSKTENVTKNESPSGKRKSKGKKKKTKPNVQ